MSILAGIYGKNWVEEFHEHCGVWGSWIIITWDIRKALGGRFLEDLLQEEKRLSLCLRQRSRPYFIFKIL